VATAEAYLHQVLHAYRSVRRWIAPSRFVLEKAVTHGVARERLRLLPHGIERRSGDGNGSARGAAPAATPGAARGPCILFSGRLSVEKGVRLLPELARRLAPVPLRVVGEGPLRGWLEAEASAIPTLEVLGHVDDGTLAALREAASVVVVPSLFYEHFCYAVAEALLDRRPVVASAIGAIPELVEHEVTGLLVTPGDPDALAGAVRRALSEDAAAGWGRAGHDRVASLGPARHLAGLLEIYHETLDPGRPT
jgi:glycosyltransferase involved in cell wall biosynthesis